MKKKLFSFLACSFCGTLLAQEYTPLQISAGYNADVIANGVGPSLLSTTSAFDNANYALMAADFVAFEGDAPATFALPLSGIINNGSMPGLSYQLASYAGDNALRLAEQLDSGVFTIANGTPATAIYLLAATGSGSGTFGGTINFSDNSTQSITGTIPDWFFSNALPVVISGFGRINLTTDVFENPATDPRFYQYAIDILPANQTKTISSIEFNKQSFEEGVINIFAVSAQLLGNCPPPAQLSVSSITNISAMVDWTTPVIFPNMGYEYYLSTNNTAPTSNTVPTGAASTSNLFLNDLTTGLTYCLWVRSHCSEAESGPWTNSICFTPGQIDTTNPNDIPTLYILNEVDTTATTTCPGTLSVTVPDGYMILSVATSYNMQTASNGWMSEQRSILVCTTNGMTESQISSGLGGTTGTYNYSRTGIDIANNLTGVVDFELRAWRTYGGSDCSVDYNRVVAGTWIVTVTVSPTLVAKDFSTNDFAVYPNPSTNALTVSGNEMITEVRLFNILGQEVLHQNGLNTKQVQLSTENLTSGKYILKITSESGTKSKGILKN
jgi:hypothetical protein